MLIIWTQEMFPYLGNPVNEMQRVGSRGLEVRGEEREEIPSQLHQYTLQVFSGREDGREERGRTEI